MSILKGATGTGGSALSDLSWTSDHSIALREVLDLIHHDDLQTVRTWLLQRTEAQLRYISDLSAEKSSHFKWLLASSYGEYKVWLHEYKPGPLRRNLGGHAGSIHNHRYSFISKVLRGDLQVTYFEIRGGSLVPSSQVTYPEGSRYLMTSDAVHCIDGLSAGTVTLIVEGPTERHYSTVYDRNGAPPVNIPDLETLALGLADRTGDGHAP